MIDVILKMDIVRSMNHIRWSASVRVCSHCLLSCFRQHHERSYFSPKSTTCWQWVTEKHVNTVCIRKRKSPFSLYFFSFTHKRTDDRFLTQRPLDSPLWTSTASGCVQVWGIHEQCTSKWGCCHMGTRQCPQPPLSRWYEEQLCKNTWSVITTVSGPTASESLGRKEKGKEQGIHTIDK